MHVSLNSIMKNAIYATQTDISNILSLYNSTATVFKSPGPWVSLRITIKQWVMNITIIRQHDASKHRPHKSRGHCGNSSWKWSPRTHGVSPNLRSDMTGNLVGNWGVCHGVCIFSIKTSGFQQIVKPLLGSILCIDSYSWWIGRTVPSYVNLARPPSFNRNSSRLWDLVGLLLLSWSTSNTEMSFQLGATKTGWNASLSRSVQTPRAAIGKPPSEIVVTLWNTKKYGNPSKEKNICNNNDNWQ